MALIVRSKLARADPRSAWLFIDRDDIDAADRLLERIDQTVRTIAECPEIGESQDDFKLGLRRFVVGNYLIFYEPIPEGIRVVRVLHGARRWEVEF